MLNIFQILHPVVGFGNQQGLGYLVCFGHGLLGNWDLRQFPHSEKPTYQDLQQARLTLKDDLRQSPQLHAQQIRRTPLCRH
jgi:hypothetical protein